MKKARALGDGYMLYYRAENKASNGVVICLSEHWQNKVIAVQRIDSKAAGHSTMDNFLKSLRPPGAWAYYFIINIIQSCVPL